MHDMTSSADTTRAKEWLSACSRDRPCGRGTDRIRIVETDGRHCRMLHYGALKVASRRQKECAGAVLQDVHARVCSLIEEFSPDVMAVESVFTALNMRTALRLAEVRGVILLAAASI